MESKYDCLGRGSIKKKKVDGRVITPNLFIFFMVPIHPNLQRKFFVGGDGGGVVVGRYLTSPSSLHFIFEATA